MAEQSSFNVFRRAGKTRGEYTSSLRSLDEILSERSHEEQIGQVRTERREEGLDTLMAAVELGSTLYGGYKDKQEFEGTLSQLETATGEDVKIIGKEGRSWDDMNLWDKMWSEQSYQFGDKILSKADVQGYGTLHKYGIFDDDKLKSLTGVSPTVTETFEDSSDIPSDIRKNIIERDIRIAKQKDLDYTSLTKGQKDWENQQSLYEEAVSRGDIIEESMDIAEWNESRRWGR